MPSANRTGYTARMDNITHTIIGTLVGEVTARVAPSRRSTLPPATRRNLCVTLAAVGSNLPDSDLLYSFFGRDLNYLLHHRGHTHTVVIAVLLGLAVLAITRWWIRRRGLQASPADYGLLAGVLLFTPLLHIAMDFTNNYGVHPFWPVDNRWFYGDSVFIIEPLLWAACAPLAFIFRTHVARFAVLLLMVGAIALCFFSGMVPQLLAAAYALLVAAMLLVGQRAPTKVALAAGVTLWLGVTAMFALSAQTARAHIDAIAARQFPEGTIVDRIVTPMPVNPTCWEVMLLQKEGDNAVLRRAMLALSPAWLTADKCLSRSLDMPITAPLVPVPSDNTEQVKWYGQISTPLARLATLAATNCEAAAALRFIRMPWLANVKDGLVLGDLRYDREEELGFAEIALGEPPVCPSFVPKWVEPRRDLLEPGAANMSSARSQP
ncbi:metal-dependent hydrolase [Steroidobacter sp. S1-65]|uniref:Metal-dependent hydrolase n=1 Tax=Steroidobacter gossypii TaxID=2805490 RepID=A0ABS1WSD5_9GAMM|nr:metal-dependent hydrolase [Steroidobacter gossypii]MBM0103882.1 metal-dependent hydrolase [Steroidobacter gossypii]